MSNNSALNVYSVHIECDGYPSSSTVFPSQAAFFEWASNKENPLKSNFPILSAITPDGFKDPRDVGDDLVSELMEDYDPEFFEDSFSRRWEIGDNSIMLVSHRFPLDSFEVFDQPGGWSFIIEAEWGVFKDPCLR